MSIIFAVILILGVTFITRSILLSLGFGLLLTSLIATNFNIHSALSLTISKLWLQLDLVSFTSTKTIFNTWSLFVFVFIFLLGFMIELMQKGGIFLVLQDIITKFAKKAVHVEILSLTLSKIFILDDYLSCLAVGSIMSNSFDKFKLTRTKLAFLIDSMSAPLALLCPISSWSVIIVGIFKSQAFINSHFTKHFSGNPLTQFFYVLPYLFYSFVIFCACWFIVLRRISFGNIDAPTFLRKEEKTPQHRNVDFIDFLVPFLSLFSGVILFNLILGESKIFGGTHGFIESFQSSNSAAALCFACLVSVCLTIGWMLYKDLLQLIEIPKLAWKGFKGIFIAILILWLSWSMSSILTQNLNIGIMIGEILSTDLPVPLLPVIFFILSLLTGFVTGTSWGTVAIVAPIVISIFDSVYVASGLSLDPNLLMICIGATISGGICGDHLSPLCSTTVMAAISSGISPILHARTQIYYTIPIAVSTLGAFYFAATLVSYGIIISSVACGLCAIFLCCAILEICSRSNANNLINISQSELGLSTTNME